MDVADRIRELGRQVETQVKLIQTEEATKNALIMPFISALGYNVFNPLEVTPELHADVGVKKGEKVDYAILKDGAPIILFECKWHGADLNKEHASQLYRYFSVTDARFGVLTNGLEYRFYTDLDAPNKMDARPFFTFNMLSIRDEDLDELNKFSKPVFDLQDILTTASELKYTNAMRKILQAQLTDPSDDFIRFFTSQVYQGRMTQAVRAQFAHVTRRALNQFVNDQITERLQSVMNPSATIVVPEPGPDAETTPEPVNAVITTTDEIEAFYTIRAILHPDVDTTRIVMRDVQSYCGVLLDDNNRKPICRLYFNRALKFVGLFDNPERKEERVSISAVGEIHSLAARLKATLASYT